MQYLLVESLRALDTPEACKMAFDWASRWVRSNFIAYKQTRTMFEKYSAEEMGASGGGGEYEIVTGKTNFLHFKFFFKRTFSCQLNFE